MVEPVTTNRTSRSWSVSFIVCALNEEAGIETTVKTILSVAGRELDHFEIVLVNDGSTDKTGEIMERLKREDSHVQVLHNEKNLNFGGAYRRAVAVASCDYIMVVAGQNVMPVTTMTQILGHLGQADLILPYMSDASERAFVRRHGSAGFVTILNLLFGLRIHYYNGVIPRRVLLNKITLRSNSYASLAEVAVKLLKAGCSYVEVGVPHCHKLKAKSSALRVRNIIGVFKAIIDLYREVRRADAIPSAAEVSALSIPKRNL